MLKNKLILSTTFWLLFFYTLLSLVNLFYFKSYLFEIGLTFGSILCYFKYILLIRMFYYLFKLDSTTKINSTLVGILQFVIYIIVLFVLLVLSYKIDVETFFGTLTGILFSPILAIFICLSDGYFTKEFFTSKKLK
ncbi:MAG: hypothetical protein ABF289_10270 [Clostridiales bacterium]